jgi:hypothetical protein
MLNRNSFLGAAAVLVLAGTAWTQTANVPGDFATIQEAIDAAAGGDFTVIQVANGYYRENLVVTTEGLELKGKGKKTIVDGAYVGNCLDIQANDVKVSGFAFVNGGPEAGAEGTEAGGVLWTGTGADISKCEVRHCTSFGIKLVGTGVIDNNLIVGTLGPGLWLDSEDSAGPLTVVEDNEILRNAVGVEADDGPFLFDDNLVGNNTGDGLRLTILAASGNGTSSASTEIVKNEISGNGGTALLVLDEIGSTTLIDNNKIDENGVGLDLTASNVTVTKNDIDQSQNGGAFLQTTGMTFDKNRMRRNTLVGAVVSLAPGAEDGSNSFFKNHFETSGGDGLVVQSGLNTFDTNLIQDNLGDGVSIASGATANVFIKNTSRDNGHDGFDNSGADTLFTDNTAKANLGADLAGIGDGTGTVDAASAGNSVGDESGLEAEQELELDTLPEPEP